MAEVLTAALHRITLAKADHYPKAEHEMELHKFHTLV
jgi:hypothetical protein